MPLCYKLLSVCAAVLSLTGLVIHSFIAAVNVTCWLKGRAVTSIDQVLTCLGISRMLIQIFSFLDLVFHFHIHLDPGNILDTTIECALIFVNYSSIWFATLFSVVFCLKIAVFSNALYLRLKVFISTRIVHLIAASIVISFCYILMFLYLKNSLVSTNSTEVFLTTSSRLPEMERRYIFLFIFGNIVPLLIYCMATVLLIISLCIHLTRMKCNDNFSVHLRAYYTAIRSILFCFLFNALHVASNLIALHYMLVIGALWFHIILNVLPIIHSLHLIHKIGPLRQIFSQVQCCVCKEKPVQERQ
ncbi:taste receptor type 2 member 39-like [Pseudophryne corroboree]|uniref:taste receptor type 2 member 39-like n=1 Tax=Pseudophryne corroboree TaxID=495146 RepID=UPI00308196A0